MTYYYIHGFNATGKTTADKLSKLLDAKVEVLSWDYQKTFDENIKNILKVLNVQTDKDIILMGSSMGGFYANFIANKLKVPCALFNPVLNPQQVFKKLNCAELSDEIIKSYAVLPDCVIPRLVVVGLNDNILEPDKTIEYWMGKCNLKITEDNHQIENFNSFKEDILHLSIPLLCDGIM